MLICSGCQEHSVPVTFLAEPDINLLVQTEEILGFQLEQTNEFYGSIVIELWPRPRGGIQGYFSSNGFCRPWVQSVESPRILAHELGHALGLEHRNDLENLMSESENGTALKDSQTKRMQEIIERYEECKKE